MIVGRKCYKIEKNNGSAFYGIKFIYFHALIYLRFQLTITYFLFEELLTNSLVFTQQINSVN